MWVFIAVIRVSVPCSPTAEPGTGGSHHPTSSNPISVVHFKSILWVLLTMDLGTALLTQVHPQIEGNFKIGMVRSP